MPLTLAAAGLAGIVYGVEVGLGLHTTPVWVGRVIAAPVLYLVWLLLFLGICALELRGWQKFLGYGKPARVSERESRAQFYMIMLSYMRQHLVWRLPLAQSFIYVDGLRQLLLWGAAPRLRLGSRSFLFGFVYDADLIEIGDDVVLGAESVVLAHSITTTADGDRLYVTAPVSIGARTVVAGGSRVDLGVRIGADAIIEPLSVVTAFTVVGAGEVWGGNPAQFRRMRFETAAQASSTQALPTDEERVIREIVAAALYLKPDEVTHDLSADDCDEWDSLAQMSIASALQQQLHIVVPDAERFCMRSMADIRSVVGRVRLSSAALPTATAGATSSALPAALPIPSVQSQSALLLGLPDNAELLPLMDHAVVSSSLAARLFARSNAAVAGTLSCRVVIAATFTAEPLSASLKPWSDAFGISTGIEFAGFDQVPQTLLSSDSAFANNHTGVNLVLVRPEDVLAGPEGTRDHAMLDVLDAIAQFAERMPGTLVVGTLPPAVSPFFGVDRATVERCRAEWQSRLSEIDGITLLDFAAVVERLGIDGARSNGMEVIARAPYSDAVYRELGIEIARELRRRVKAPAKVLALDADGVLWGGIVGEDGVDGVLLGPDHPGRAFHLFQQHVLALKQRGVLLALVSRNTERDVWEMFDRHPDMVLQRNDFAAARVNWEPKSQNLRALAAELGLGLDALVFVDDDPANRLEVETNAPGVIVVPLPTEASEYVHTLSRLWCFDTAAVTSEDVERTTMVRQERLRQDVSAASGGMVSYLASLGLGVEMRLAEASDLPRVAQLTQKTNQFNLSLKRRTLTEIQALGQDARVHVIRAHDRFGTYGLVGVCVLLPGDAPDECHLDTLLLSCRALGRGVEDAMLYGVRVAVQSAGATRLRAPFVEGPRNQPMREFLVRSGFQECADNVFEHRAISDMGLPAHVAWNS
ncbi:MAG: HAD-IIIC family phosphatase [Gemmatimonadota bacterium]